MIQYNEYANLPNGTNGGHSMIHDISIVVEGDAHGVTRVLNWYLSIRPSIRAKLLIDTESSREPDGHPCFHPASILNISEMSLPVDVADMFNEIIKRSCPEPVDEDCLLQESCDILGIDDDDRWGLFQDQNDDGNEEADADDEEPDEYFVRFEFAEPMNFENSARVRILQMQCFQRLIECIDTNKSIT